MPETYSGSVVTVYIPSNNEQDYVSGATSMRQSFVNLADHDHSSNPLGSSSIANAAVDTAQLADGSVTAAKLAAGITIGVVANDTYIQWRNAANSADVNGIKLNASDNLHLDPTVDNLVMSNNVSLEGRNAADSADVSIVKVDANDDLSFGAEVSVLKLKSATYLTGRNNADSGDLNGWKFNASDLLEPGIGIDFGSQNMTNVDIDSGTIDGLTILTVDNLSLDGNTLSATSGGVTITPAAGSAITLDTSMTIDGGVVAVTGDLTVDNLNLNGNTISTTSGGITLTPTAGSAITLDSSMTVDGGVVSVTGDLSVDNLNLNGNSITSTSGGITLTPLAGQVITLDSNMTVDGGVVALTGDLTVDNLNLNGNTLSSSDTDGNITLNPNGTGVIDVSADIIPETDSTHDLGSSSKGFAEAHVDSITIGQQTALTGYKEGTFTPVIDASTTSPSSVTYTRQIGRYTRIGDVVHFMLVVQPSAISGGSGDLQVTGLPYARSADNMSSPYAVSLSGLNLGASTFYVVATQDASTSILRFTEILDDAFATQLAVGTIVAGESIAVSGSYFTDAAF